MILMRVGDKEDEENQPHIGMSHLTNMGVLSDLANFVPTNLSIKTRQKRRSNFHGAQ